MGGREGGNRAIAAEKEKVEFWKGLQISKREEEDTCVADGPSAARDRDRRRCPLASFSCLSSMPDREGGRLKILIAMPSQLPRKCRRKRKEIDLPFCVCSHSFPSSSRKCKVERCAYVRTKKHHPQMAETLNVALSLKKVLSMICRNSTTLQ